MFSIGFYFKYKIGMIQGKEQWLNLTKKWLTMNGVGGYCEYFQLFLRTIVSYTVLGILRGTPLQIDVTNYFLVWLRSVPAGGHISGRNIF